MNNEYFNAVNPGAPIYYGNTVVPNQDSAPTVNSASTSTSSNNDYIDNVLQKIEPIKATFYMTFPGSNEWRDKAFEGILEAAGRDHVILHNPANGKWYLLPNIYVDYIEFNEDIQKYIRKTS